MNLKGLIDIDLVNYKKPSMTLIFPICKNFKCDKECGKQVCQNSRLATAPDITISQDDVIQRYLNNPITEAIVCQGLEPFDSWYSLFHLIYAFRKISNDDIVIYTGYTEEELKGKLHSLCKFENIIIKFGRFIPGQKYHHDDVLGVNLASDNQYAKEI